MARSYNIHIVTKDGNIIAAFTVRHELESWLENWKPDEEYEVTTIRDGHPLE